LPGGHDQRYRIEQYWISTVFFQEIEKKLQIDEKRGKRF
jgi:hypothetical protein